MDNTAILECLKDIVGVVKEDVEICKWAELTQEVKDAATVSTSGMFMSTLPGGIDLKSITDVNILRKMVNAGISARDAAIEEVKSEVVLGIGNRNKTSKKNYVGMIGKLTIGSTFAANKQYQGIRVAANSTIAAMYTIKGIKVAVNGVDTFNVYVGRAPYGATAIEEVVATYPVTSVMNSWEVVTMAGGDLALPLSINGVEQQYYVYWDRVEAGGLSPKDNEIKCNCPGDSAQAALYAYGEINGVQFSAMDNIGARSEDHRGHGISIEADIRCNSDMILCSEYDTNNEIAVALATAVRYKAGELWIEEIFKMNDVARLLVSNREYLWGKRSHYKKQFEGRVLYIAANVQLDATDCFVCREDKMIKAGIQS